VVKLVDTPDLGSGVARRGGSSPSSRTILDIYFPLKFVIYPSSLHDLVCRMATFCIFGDNHA